MIQFKTALILDQRKFILMHLLLYFDEYTSDIYGNSQYNPLTGWSEFTVF